MPGSGSDEVWLFAGDDSSELVSALRTAVPEHSREIGDSWPRGGSCRMAIAAPDPRKLEIAETIIREGKRWSGRSDIWFSPRPLAWDGGRLAFMFPGVEPLFLAENADVDSLVRNL